jgi:hypothetical protein
MKRRSDPTSAWIVDYSAARAHAIRWLGDRYLLARPINGKQDTWHKVPAAPDSPTPTDATDAAIQHLPGRNAA